MTNYRVSASEDRFRYRYMSDTDEVIAATHDKKEEKTSVVADEVEDARVGRTDEDDWSLNNSDEVLTKRHDENNGSVSQQANHQTNDADVDARNASCILSTALNQELNAPVYPTQSPELSTAGVEDDCSGSVFYINPALNSEEKLRLGYTNQPKTDGINHLRYTGDGMGNATTVWSSLIDDDDKDLERTGETGNKTRWQGRRVEECQRSTNVDDEHDESPVNTDRQSTYLLACRRPLLDDKLNHPDSPLTVQCSVLADAAGVRTFANWSDGRLFSITPSRVSALSCVQTAKNGIHFCLEDPTSIDSLTFSPDCSVLAIGRRCQPQNSNQQHRKCQSVKLLNFSHGRPISVEYCDGIPSLCSSIHDSTTTVSSSAVCSVLEYRRPEVKIAWITNSELLIFARNQGCYFLIVKPHKKSAKIVKHYPLKHDHFKWIPLPFGLMTCFGSGWQQQSRKTSTGKVDMFKFQNGSFARLADSDVLALFKNQNDASGQSDALLKSKYVRLVNKNYILIPDLRDVGRGMTVFNVYILITTTECSSWKHQHDLCIETNQSAEHVEMTTVNDLIVVWSRFLDLYEVDDADLLLVHRFNVDAGPNISLTYNGLMVVSEEEAHAGRVFSVSKLTVNLSSLSVVKRHDRGSLKFLLRRLHDDRQLALISNACLHLIEQPNSTASCLKAAFNDMLSYGVAVFSQQQVVRVISGVNNKHSRLIALLSLLQIVRSGPCPELVFALVDGFSDDMVMLDGLAWECARNWAHSWQGDAAVRLAHRLVEIDCEKLFSASMRILDACSHHLMVCKKLLAAGRRDAAYRYAVSRSITIRDSLFV